MKQTRTFSRRQALTTALGALAMPLVPAPGTAASADPVLVELFTSQGCSSCPRADKLAAELASDPGLIVISYHVDYWDYLGWRDTFGSPACTKRQRDYAASRGDNDIYTPQVIVNGGKHCAGSDRGEVLGLISERQGVAYPAAISLAIDAKEIKVSIPEASQAIDATLWLMAIAPKLEQKIERGENSGATIAYHNVVRNMVPAAMWKGERFAGSWMRKAVMTDDTTMLVAVLQLGETGKVLGVSRAIT